MARLNAFIILLAAFAMSVSQAHGSKLISVSTVDEEHVMIVFQDSQVKYKDDGKGPTAFIGAETQGPDEFIRHGEPLNTAAAALPTSYRLDSNDDAGFRETVRPSACFRKTKVSGTAWGWPNPEPSFEHTIFLRLPKKLKSGSRYRLHLSADALKCDRASVDFPFDPFTSVSEALHVNLIGYHPEHTQAKSADLYMWLGDGGARDYKSFEGRTIWLVHATSGERHNVGKVSFWKKRGADFGGRNLTASDVWTCDFSSFREAGTYRLVVEGIGCSPEFALRNDVYFDPFRVSLRGFYYMRIGEPFGQIPPPRQPRFIPNQDPPDFTVYLTTLNPWHPDWKTLPGDVWDVRDWSKWREPGNPTNPNAYGGHSDAADWDRHCGHVSIIWDLLLPYILTNGRGGEDNLGIRESGNGIPDVIDEARNEVDLWLRLRDQKGGYSAGLNNPSDDKKVMYQAGAKPFMAWVNAANAAMLAEAFRIAKRPVEMAKYRDAAIEAWGIANEQDLDESHHIGLGKVRGRDMKQMAAAYLYNVTGEKRFEDTLAELSEIKSPTSPTEVVDQFNQLWGTAAYLTCSNYKVRPVRKVKLLQNMISSVIHEAMTKNVANTSNFPSRRSADNAYAWFQTVTEVQRICVAHMVARNSIESDALLRAMILEADYGLGRNPINSVLMTGLGSRHVEDIYTSGRNDGVPGVHPGHTPYMNVEPWGEGFMFDPRWMASRGYPEWNLWPHGEAIWRARYCFANNEFTPQQTMRGKHCLYGYLYGIGSPRQ